MFAGITSLCGPWNNYKPFDMYLLKYRYFQTLTVIHVLLTIQSLKWYTYHQLGPFCLAHDSGMRHSSHFSGDGDGGRFYKRLYLDNPCLNFSETLLAVLFGHGTSVNVKMFRVKVIIVQNLTFVR